MTEEEEVVRSEVAEWEDDVVMGARFKALSGQRSDWEPLFLFWTQLILRVARRLGRFTVPAHHLLNLWFRRRGLTPLCLPQVLQEMRNNGDILLKADLIHPTSGRLHQIITRVSRMVGTSRSSIVPEDILIFKPLIEERTTDILRNLSESHWTSTCVITISNFHSFFKDHDEAYIALNYLCECGKARYLSIKNEDLIEGVKLPFVAAQVPAISKLDYDALRLTWTAEKLQQQLDVIDRRWEISRKNALTSFKSGNKKAAYRHIRHAKLFSESRDKCTSLLERVEEVIALIANAESTKKVYEAIQIANQAIKDHSISTEEVHLHLQEVDELVASQKELHAALGSVPLQSLDVEEDFEEEFRQLEAELEEEFPRMQAAEPAAPHQKEPAPDDLVESLSHNLSNLNLEAA